MSRFWFICALVVAGAFAMHLRMTAATGPLWLDEQHTAWVTAESIADVAPRATIGNQTPVYFWLIHTVRSWMGVDSPRNLRIVSFLCGWLVIVISAMAVYRCTRSSVAACLTFFVAAFDPFFCFWGTEARPYVLVQLLGLIQTGLFLTLFADVKAPVTAHEPKTEPVTGSIPYVRLVLFALLCSILIGVHVTSVWIGVAQLVWLIVMTIRGRLPSGAWRNALIAALMVGVLSIPWIGLSGLLMQRRGNWNSLSSIPQTLTALSPLLIAALAGLLVQTVGALMKQQQSGPACFAKLRMPDLLLLASCCCFVPVLCILGAHIIGLPLSLPRYAAVGLAGIPILIGLSVGALNSRLLRYALVAILLCILLPMNRSLVYWYRTGNTAPLRSENWTEIADAANNPSMQSIPVLLFANVIEDVDALVNEDPAFQEYLLFPVSGLDRIHRENRKVVACPTVLAGEIAPETLQLVTNRRAGLLVIRAARVDRMAILTAVVRQIEAIDGEGVVIEPLIEHAGNDVGLFMVIRR